MIKKFSEFINENASRREPSPEVESMDLNEFYNHLVDNYDPIWDEIHKSDEENLIYFELVVNSTDSIHHYHKIEVLYEKDEKIILFDNAPQRDVEDFIEHMEEKSFHFAVDFVDVNDKGEIVSEGLKFSKYIRLTYVPLYHGEPKEINNVAFEQLLIDFIDTKVGKMKYGKHLNAEDIDIHGDDVIYN